MTDEEVEKLRVTGKSTCVWTIKNFSSLDSTVGRCYTKTFRLEAGSPQKFLTIWPGGETEDSKGYLCCSTGILNGKINGELRCQILLNTLITGRYNQHMTGYSFSMRYPFMTEKIPKIFDRNLLISRLVKDTLEITLEMTYDWTSCVEENDIIQPSLDLTTMSKVANDWRDLWKSKENADCVIAVGGKDILAHSIVLGVRSKVFAAMFKHQTFEKRNFRVEIDDFEKDTVDSLLEFLYSGSVSNMHFDLASELLRASDKYDLSDLKSYCSDFLATHLDDHNVCHTLFSADTSNDEKLRIEALRYFCENLTKLDFEGNRPMFEANPKLLGDIMMEIIEQKKKGTNDGDCNRRRQF